MKVTLAALVLVSSATAEAAAITIDETALEIPAPEGFVAVTPQMSPLYELQRKLVPPVNKQLMGYIAEAHAKIALSGEVPPVDRSFALQTSRKLTGVSASAEDFAQLKGIVRTQNEQVIKEAEQQVPEILERANRGISEELDVDLALEKLQMIPLEPHRETDQTLAYSSYVGFNMSDGAGGTERHARVVTVTLVHVKGKILFLYAYAEKDDLDWSREASGKWADAVVAANR